MVKTALIAAVALVAGFALGVVLSWSTIRHLRRRVKQLRAGKAPISILQSVTRLLFVTTQLFALGWVSVSYGIAVYSTVVLMQPFPVVELSQQAISTILGVTALKVVENIFEHNEGLVFGRKPGTAEPPGEVSTNDEPPEGPAGETEGRG